MTSISETLAESDPFDINPERITRHRVEIGKARLSLADYGDFQSAGLVLEDFSDRAYTVKEWESREKAVAEYPAIERKIREGEYRLEVYDNGEVKIVLGEG